MVKQSSRKRYYLQVDVPTIETEWVPPEGWSELICGNGKRVYLNQHTLQTQVVPPTIPAKQLPVGWKVEYKDGDVIYINRHNPLEIQTDLPTTSTIVPPPIPKRLYFN